MRGSRQLAHLANLLGLPPRPGKHTLPIRQLRLAPRSPHQATDALLFKAPRFPDRYTAIVCEHSRILRNLGQRPQVHDLRNMRFTLLLYPHHTVPQYLLIPLNLLLLFLLVLAIYLVPFERVLWRIILRLPVGDITSDEGAPELGIFVTDLWGAKLDLVELFRRLDALENGSDLPVFEGTDVVQAYGAC